ncbi:MAG: hypothetical protein LBC21_04300 [Oscillospiraceae bacterium]|nr:hypothetical protein [Oscillospiraceae bacterium]
MAVYKVVFDSSQAAVFKSAGNELAGYGARLRNAAGALDNVDGGLLGAIDAATGDWLLRLPGETSFSPIARGINAVADALAPLADVVKLEGVVLERSVDTYKRAESASGTFGTGFSVISGDGTAAYDDFGTYGGAQNSPAAQWDDLAGIVRQYFPKKTDREIKRFLEEFNTVGCGYVAISNTIFARYIGRADEFEATFGFPMYTESGELNFNAAMIDFYCSKGKIGSGTTRESRERMWESYMREHGIAVDVYNCAKPTAGNYDSMARRGEIIMSMNPLCLRNENGAYVDVRKGGHAVVVTGVTESGLFIVSSWGQTYYVDPVKDSGKLTYQQVAYK